VVGPQVSFLLSTQNFYNNGFTTTVQNQYNQDSQGYTKTLLDGVLGISIDLNRNVELRGRYTIDLQNNSAYNPSYNPQYANQAWQIGIGYKF
jgi:opacity protein-like surface antigen